MSRRLGLLAFLVTVSVALAPATATAKPDARTAAPPSLRQLAKGIVAVGSPGAVVYVRDANGARAGVAGYANLRTKERLTANHAFRVGSITKTFVATVVLQLEAEGVLRLDDSVERWLPGLVPNGQAITLRHLLSHTSGIYNYTDDPELLRAFVRNRLEVWTPARIVALATRHPPLFAPGANWSYSNTGYILLGLVVERATGTTLAQQLQGRIIEPLRLTRTSLPDLPTIPPPVARGYLLVGNGLVSTPGRRPADVTTWSPTWAWAAGALVSTADDLGRFYRALLRGELLGPAQLEAMRRTVPIGFLPGNQSYGLGISLVPLRCGLVWGHGGSVFGYTSLAFSSPDGSRQAVVLVNSSVSSIIGARFEGAFTSAFCR